MFELPSPETVSGPAMDEKLSGTLSNVNLESLLDAEGQKIQHLDIGTTSWEDVLREMMAARHTCQVSETRTYALVAQDGPRAATLTHLLAWKPEWELKLQAGLFILFQTLAGCNMPSRKMVFQAFERVLCLFDPTGFADDMLPTFELYLDDLYRILDRGLPRILVLLGFNGDGIQSSEPLLVKQNIEGVVKRVESTMDHLVRYTEDNEYVAVDVTFKPNASQTAIPYEWGVTIVPKNEKLANLDKHAFEEVEEQIQRLSKDLQLQKQLRTAVVTNNINEITELFSEWKTAITAKVDLDDGNQSATNLIELLSDARYDTLNPDNNKAIDILLEVLHEDKMKPVVYKVFSEGLQRGSVEKSGVESTGPSKWLNIAERIVQSHYTTLMPATNIGNGGITSTEMNAIHLTARYRSPSALKKIIQRVREHNSELDGFRQVLLSQTSEGQTALTFAIRNLDKAIVSQLLVEEHGFLNKFCWQSKTFPLHELVLAIRNALDAVYLIDEAEAILDLIVSKDAECLLQNCERIASCEYSGGPPYPLLCKVISEVTSTNGRRRSSAIAEEVAPESKRLESLRRFQGRMKTLIFKHLKTGDIPKALHQDEANYKLINLDLIDFTASSAGLGINDFPLFVNAFEKGRSILKFEDTLHSVRMPVWPPGQTALQKEQTTQKLFAVLRNTYHIQKIFRFDATNTFQTGVDQKRIAEWVDDFSVEELVWRNLDPDLGFFPPCPSIRSLQLYSSGNSSILFSWVSERGILKFSQLEEVVFWVVSSGKESRDHHDSVKSDLQNSLQKFKGQRDLKLDVWFRTERELNTRRETYLPNKDPSFRFFEPLDGITDRISQMSPEVWPAVKVAIIDTGIDSMHDEVSGNIEKGASFVPSDSGHSYPWFTTTDPHGTQMASLILRINPLCRLYIYRIAAGSVGSKMHYNHAAQAIQAAVNDGVDIINASWSFDRDYKEIKQAIRRATTEIYTDGTPCPPVLLFASKSDEMFAGNVYPADYENTISVGAATTGGRVGSESNKNADLIVLGENMPACGPAYAVGVKERVTGSSVATALATGMASLFLMIAKNRHPQNWQEFREKRKMLDVFLKMRPAVDSTLHFVDTQQAVKAVKAIADGDVQNDRLDNYL